MEIVEKIIHLLVQRENHIPNRNMGQEKGKGILVAKQAKKSKSKGKLISWSRTRPYIVKIPL